MSHNNRARARAGAFRTDTDISRQKPAPGERELQPWQPDPSGDALEGGLGDDVTFGGAVGKTGGGKGWDQFATNAALFGATTTYSEDLYTTRLDRSKQGFKQREREAERLAREIEGQVTTNVHVAEERGQQVQGGEGWDEEDRYSGVQRRAGAYVPPGARSGKVVGKETGKDVKEDKETPAQPTTELATHDSGNAKAPPQEPIKPSPAKDALKVSPAKPNPSPASAAPADITSTMREFAQTERSKIAQAKADMHKTERDRRLAELVNFGKTFKVPGAKPRELQGVLAGSAAQEKREEKNVAKAVPAPAPAVASSKPQLANGHRPPIASGTHAAKPRISMHIPEIPPFKGAARPMAPSQQQQQQQPPKLVVPATADTPVPGIAAPSQTTKDAKRPDAPPVVGGLNPAAAAFAFKPNPAASTFKPGNMPVPAGGANGSGQALPPISTKMPPQPVPGAVTHMNGPGPAPHAHQQPVRNPFFIVPPRRVPGVNVRDEFNPMRSRRAGRPEDTPMVWQYSGRRVLQALHQPMHPSGMYSLHVNGVHPNLGPGGGPPVNVVPGPGGMIPPMQHQGPHPHVVGPAMPGPGMSPMVPPAAQQQQQKQQQQQAPPPPNGMSPAAGTGISLEDERFSPIPTQPGGPAFQPGGPPPPGAGAGGGPGMGPGFNAYRGPHQPMQQHMGQPGMFAQYPGNGGVFMGNPMMQGMPYNPQMMGNGPMRPAYYPQPGMTSHPTSPMPHALTPQMMSPHPPP